MTCKSFVFLVIKQHINTTKYIYMFKFSFCTVHQSLTFTTNAPPTPAVRTTPPTSTVNNSSTSSSDTPKYTLTWEFSGAYSILRITPPTHTHSTHGNKRRVWQMKWTLLQESFNIINLLDFQVPQDYLLFFCCKRWRSGNSWKRWLLLFAVYPQAIQAVDEELYFKPTSVN